MLMFCSVCCRFHLNWNLGCCRRPNTDVHLWSETGVASGNFRDSGQSFVYFTEEFVVFWGGERVEPALTHDEHMLRKRKRKNSTKHSALWSSFPLKYNTRNVLGFSNRSCTSNLNTVSQQQRSWKNRPHDIKLDITCGFKMIVKVLTCAGFSCPFSTFLFA